MARRRSSTPTFGLSFLDSMSCGLGAVVLVFMIINHAAEERSDERNEDLLTRVAALETEVLDGSQRVLSLKAALDNTLNASELARREAEALSKRIAELQSALPVTDEASAESRTRIARLQAELQALEAQVLELRAAAADRQDDASREIAGEGRRQYLTGLRVEGQRILFLVDSSASMLGETIVEAVRRRNMRRARKLASPKWQRTLASLEWLVARMPTQSRFQIFSFNIAAEPVVAGSAGQWLGADDADKLGEAITALRALEPGKGTSLHAAFAAAASLKPAPDNIFLITDGLPTQGRQIRTGTVSGAQRLRHLSRAIRQLPAGVPVNVLLLPMEGDPRAASAFWQIARNSGGAYLSPSRDWP